MAEQLVMIGKPAREIAATIGTKQLNANGLQALLQDIELRIHHAYQEACLFGKFPYPQMAPSTIRAVRIRITRVNRHAWPRRMTGPSARAQASRKDANRTPANMMRRLEDVCQIRRMPSATLNTISAAASVNRRPAPSTPDENS